MRHTRLKYLADVIPGQSPSSTEVSYLDEGLPFIQGNAEFGKLTPNPVWQCDESPKIAKTGDVLVSVRAPVGAVNIAAQPIGIGRGVAAIRPKKSILSKWIYWALIAHKQDLLAAATGSTFSAVSGTDVGNLRLSLSQDPAVVAEFLDRETAEIDAFIADQERLIELLEERRTATITLAVTKGLDPIAPMKDSGIDWLGDIPAEWSVRKLGWVSRCSSGTSISSAQFELASSDDLSIPVIGGNGVTGYTNVANINEPRIVIGRVGALCGNVHLIQEPAWITDNALRLSFDNRIFDAEYLTHLLRARNLNDLADRTAQPLITGSLVAAQRLPHPPLVEQHMIISYIRQEVAELDAAVNDAREAIELSLERRAALISAAVTGQLDVSQAQSRGSVGEVLEEEVRV